MSETYLRPKHGWTCFHCGQTFTTSGSAEDHFGKTPAAVPGCIIQAGENGLGLLIELRKAEQRAEEFLLRAQRAEDKVDSLNGQVAEYERIAGGGCNELRMKLDYMQGRVITADAVIEGFRKRSPAIFAEVIG